MAYLAITDPEIANGAVITQTLMHKNRDNLQAVCDDDASIPPANTLKRMGRQNAIIIGATDPGGSELLRVGGSIKGSTGDGGTGMRLVAVTGMFRARPYVDATNGLILDSSNAAENAYLPMTLIANPLRLLGNSGTGIVVNSSGAVTIGTDPGGSELLRVGGGARVGTYLLCGDNIGLFGTNADVYSNTGVLSLRSQLALQFGSNAISNRMRLATDGTLTIGSDPGGSELLRVGGGIRAGYLMIAAPSATTLLNSSAASDPTTSAYISLQRNGVEKGWVGYGVAVNGELGISNTIGVVKIYSNTVIGTDPGGSALLRVGGDVSIKVPMTWPNANVGGVLQNDGAGNMSWVTIAAGGVTSATFSPLLQGTSGNSHSYNANTVGRYWLDGKTVRFVVKIQLNTKDPTMTGAVKIGGLPFTSDATYFYPSIVGPTVALTGNPVLVGMVVPGATQCNLYTAGTFTALDSSIITNSTIIHLSGHYTIP